MSANCALSDMLARVKHDAQRVVGGDVPLVDTRPSTLRLEEEARAYLAQHDYPAAQAALGRLVLSFPDNAGYILDLAASHQRLGHYDRALLHYQAVLGMAPALSVYYHAAICHLGLDEPDAAADLLKPGGRLVYSVCTPAPEEGREVIEAAIASGAWRRVPVTAGEIPGFAESLTADGDLLTAPLAADAEAPRTRCDVFYIARLERN